MLGHAAGDAAGVVALAVELHGGGAEEDLAAALLDFLGQRFDDDLLRRAGRLGALGDEGVGYVQRFERAAVPPVGAAVALVVLDDGGDAVGLHLVHEPVHGFAGLVVDEPPLLLVEAEAVRREDLLEDGFDLLAGEVEAQLVGEARVERRVGAAARHGAVARGDYHDVGAFLDGGRGGDEAAHAGADDEDLAFHGVSDLALVHGLGRNLEVPLRVREFLGIEHEVARCGGDGFLILRRASGQAERARRGRGGSHRQARPRQEIAARQRRMRARLPVNLLRHRDPPCSCFAAVASACESASSTACLTPAVVMVAPLIASMPAPCAASIMAANLPSRMAS